MNFEITDPAVVSFFRENPFLDLNKFFAHAIEVYKTETAVAASAKRSRASAAAVPPSAETVPSMFVEYQSFLRHKDNLQTMIREFQKSVQTEMGKMKLGKLESFFEHQLEVQINEKDGSFICELCGVYRCNTRKSLALHKRSCNRRLQNCRHQEEENEVMEEQEEEIENNDDDDDDDEDKKGCL
jgi:hypothetical protein